MKLNSLENPEVEEAKQKIDMNVGSSVIVAFTKCVASFRGKFHTDLSQGDRIVIIKEDKTCMVHSVDKKEPRNYQRSGAEIKTEVEDGLLNIKTKQVGGNEYLDIKMYDIYELAIYNAVDKAELQKEGTEEDMKKYIWNNPNSVVEDNFRVIDDEVECPDGDIDLLGVDSDNVKTVIEIKRRKGVKDHVRQLESYTRHYRQNIDENSRGILIAPDISKGAKERLDKKELEFIPLHPMETTDSKEVEKTKITDFEDVS